MPVNAAYMLLVSLLFIGAQFVYFPLLGSSISKLTPAEGAAFYQCLTFTVCHTTIMFSRILAGATFHRMPMMYTCFFLTICWLFGLIWLGIEYKNLEKDENWIEINASVKDSSVGGTIKEKGPKYDN
jgi:hypothetical protein